MWQSLVANFAVIGLFGFVWLHSQDLLLHVRRRYRFALFGVAMGAGAIVSMLLSSELQPGVIFDLRGCFVAMAAFLGGPIAVAITALMAGGFRMAMGGVGVAAALMSIALVSAIGLAARAIVDRRGPNSSAGPGAVLAFSLVTATAPLGGFVLLPEAMLGIALSSAVPIVFLGFVGTSVATFLGMSR